MHTETPVGHRLYCNFSATVTNVVASNVQLTLESGKGTRTFYPHCTPQNVSSFHPIPALHLPVPYPSPWRLSPLHTSHSHPLIVPALGLFKVVQNHL